MLAEISNDLLGSAVVVLIAITALIGQFVTIWQNLRGRPAAGELQTQVTALAKDVERVEGDVEALREEVRNEWRDAEKRSEERVKALHERINPIDREIGGLRSAVESNTSVVARLDTKIDRILEKAQ